MDRREPTSGPFTRIWFVRSLTRVTRLAGRYVFTGLWCLFRMHTSDVLRELNPGLEDLTAFGPMTDRSRDQMSVSQSDCSYWTLSMSCIYSPGTDRRTSSLNEPLPCVGRYLILSGKDLITTIERTDYKRLRNTTERVDIGMRVQIGLQCCLELTLSENYRHISSPCDMSCVYTIFSYR